MIRQVRQLVRTGETQQQPRVKYDPATDDYNKSHRALLAVMQEDKTRSYGEFLRAIERMRAHGWSQNSVGIGLAAAWDHFGRKAWVRIPGIPTRAKRTFRGRGLRLIARFPMIELPLR